MARSLWNHETGERLLTLPGHGARVTLSEDGRWLYRQPFENFSYGTVGIGEGDPVRVYDPTSAGNRSSVSARPSAFSPDGRLLADADSSQLRIYDPFSGRDWGAGPIPPTAGLAFDGELNLWSSGAEGLTIIPVRHESDDRILVFGPPESVGPAEVMERSACRRVIDPAVGANDRFRPVFDVQTPRGVFATAKAPATVSWHSLLTGKLLASAAWGGRQR